MKTMWCHATVSSTPQKEQGPRVSYHCPNSQLPSLKLTYHLKMDGWNTSFLLGWPIFKGYVSFREGTIETHFHFHRNSHHPSHPHALSTTTAATAKVRKRTSSRLGSRKKSSTFTCTDLGKRQRLSTTFKWLTFEKKETNQIFKGHHGCIPDDSKDLSLAGDFSVQSWLPTAFRKPSKYCQWIFLVPLIGGR